MSKVIKGINDLATTDPNIVKEWNYDKNKDITPFEVVRGSAKRVWWKCDKGHEWQTVIYARTKGNTKCPYCCNQKILAGYNDLKTNNPGLAKEWNYDKNSNLKPSEVSPNTTRKVWWVCDKGHEWKASISDRQRGDGCPYCSGHKILKGFNDLFTTNPELKTQWDYNKNKNIDPSNLSKGSSKKVWWICDKKHSYQQIINSKSSGIGCPICDGKKIKSGYNDLKTKNPSLAKEWNYEKNGDLTPDMIAPNSNKKVWWKCSKCGFEWEAVISSRNHGAGCPKCTNHLKKNVLQYDKDNNLINEYDSISSASKSTGIHTTSISNVCKGNAKTAGGYVWRYAKNISRD